jgi:hypothetical protein
MAGRVACLLVLLSEAVARAQARPGPDQAALCGVDLVRLLVATACPVWRSSAHGGKPSTGRQRA